MVDVYYLATPGYNLSFASHCHTNAHTPNTQCVNNRGSSFTPGQEPPTYTNRRARATRRDHAARLNCWTRCTWCLADNAPSWPGRCVTSGRSCGSRDAIVGGVGAENPTCTTSITFDDSGTRSTNSATGHNIQCEVVPGHVTTDNVSRHTVSHVSIGLWCGEHCGRGEGE